MCTVRRSRQPTPPFAPVFAHAAPSIRSAPSRHHRTISTTRYALQDNGPRGQRVLRRSALTCRANGSPSTGRTPRGGTLNAEVTRGSRSRVIGIAANRTSRSDTRALLGALLLSVNRGGPMSAAWIKLHAIAPAPASPDLHANFLIQQSSRQSIRQSNRQSCPLILPPSLRRRRCMHLATRQRPTNATGSWRRRVQEDPRTGLRLGSTRRPSRLLTVRRTLPVARAPSTSFQCQHIARRTHQRSPLLRARPPRQRLRQRLQSRRRARRERRHTTSAPRRVGSTRATLCTAYATK